MAELSNNNNNNASPATATATASSTTYSKGHTLRNFFFSSENNQEPEPQHASLPPAIDMVAPLPPRQQVRNRRESLQRSRSQPSRMHEAGNALGPLAPSPMSPTGMQTGIRSPSSSSAAALRSAVFGSCSQVIATVTMALFNTLNTHRVFVDTSNTTLDSTTVRKAKLVYITLLEKVQKERGEWQGFSDDPKSGTGTKTAGPEQEEQTALEVLYDSLVGLTTGETCVILNELLDVGFRNLRGSLVATELYLKYKKELCSHSLECPPSLQTLLLIRTLLQEMGRDEKQCLLRLLIFWQALASVDTQRHDLMRIIEEKHSQIFNENAEVEFMTKRRSSRQDPVAMQLVLLLVNYRDVLFSDLEYYSIHHEMQLTATVANDEGIPEECQSESEYPSSHTLAVMPTPHLAVSSSSPALSAHDLHATRAADPTRSFGSPPPIASGHPVIELGATKVRSPPYSYSSSGEVGPRHHGASPTSSQHSHASLQDLYPSLSLRYRSRPGASPRRRRYRTRSSGGSQRLRSKSSSLTRSSSKAKRSHDHSAQMPDMNTLLTTSLVAAALCTAATLAILALRGKP